MQHVRFHTLPALGAIRFEGPDATTFLQAQLTADLRLLGPGRSGLAAWCSPQGRVIALLQLTPLEEGWLAILPRELSAAVADRLRRFVMRARVVVSDLSEELVVAGVSGGESGSFETCPGVTTLRLTVERDLLAAPAGRLRDALAGVPPADDGAWDLDCIRLGEPQVFAPTSEHWVPQMLNLDLLGAVSFHKGCYPGQEIVARTQNLGRIKRRLFRYLVTDGPPPAPGTALCHGTARVGEVVRTATRGEVGELLAVVNLDAAGVGLTDEGGTLTCSPEPLPYAVPEASGVA